MIRQFSGTPSKLLADSLGGLGAKHITSFKLVQPLKTFVEIVVTVAGKVIVSKFVQFLKVASLTKSTNSPKLTSFNLEIKLKIFTPESTSTSLSINILLNFFNEIINQIPKNK